MAGRGDACTKLFPVERSICIQFECGVFAITRKKQFNDEVKSWSVQDRISTARAVVHKLTYNVQQVIELHASNEIIQYTNKLSKQIPRSYAAVAFNTFIDAQFQMEVIRLVALWEKPDSNSLSIPAAIALIDEDHVISELSKDILRAHIGNGIRALSGSKDKSIRDQISVELEEYQKEFASQQAELSIESLKRAIEKAKITISSTETESIQNFRDWSSHSLVKTRREEKGFDRKMKYGEEKVLLMTTVKLIEDLYCWVNGTSFDISGECFEQARRHAEELWLNCHFKIPN